MSPVANAVIAQNSISPRMQEVFSCESILGLPGLDVSWLSLNSEALISAFARALRQKKRYIFLAYQEYRNRFVNFKPWIRKRNSC